MSAREIVRYPHDVLSTPAEEVGAVTDDVRRLFDEMVETMYAENGVGVAAPQVGEPIRALVVDADVENRGSRILKMVNPRFTSMEGRVVWPEGCLSLPGLVLDVNRSEQVVVEGLDENGELVSVECDGLTAVAFQHEIDHLDGKLILDRVSRLKREFYRRKIAKHGYPVEMPGAETSDDEASDDEAGDDARQAQG